MAASKKQPVKGGPRAAGSARASDNVLGGMAIQVLDAIADMVFVKGPKSHIVWVNKAFRDYYGMSNEQLKDLIDSPINEPDYTQQYIKDDAHVFNTGKTLDIPSEPVKRHDGEVRFFHTVKSPIFNAEGKVVMTVGVSRDITEAKKLREMILQSEKMAAVGQLAAGVAHEINNPLGVILGFAQSAVSRMEKTDPLHMSLHSIEREAQRCKTLVQELLTFSRTGSPAQEKADLNQIVAGSLSLVETRARTNQVQVINKLMTPLPPIQANCNQIQQVIINLANNAIDAMPNGGVISVDTKVVQEGSRAWVCFTMRDNGSGIPTENMPHIFEPFFTTKPVGKGTGLGLSLVYEIMKKHEGTIEAQSRPGETIFCVKFPRADANGAKP